MVAHARPNDVHDREREWALLTRMWESPRPELGLVLGRRRVGKSHVLARFAEAVGGLYYQATRRSEAEQLRALSRLAGERLGDPVLRHGQPFEDWLGFLRYLGDRSEGAPFLLVLDEFPWLEEAASGLSSVIQSWLDHDLRGTRVKLILSGSYVAAMKNLERLDQPLYGRRTLRLLLSPFSYLDAAAFYPNYSPRDRLLTYAVFGGLPGHLALVDPSRSWDDNVVRHVLDPSARLFDEGQHVLDGFHAESEVHYSAMAAIAGGERTWSRICSRIGKSSGSLARPMQWLLDMELVRREVPITELRPERSRRALYQVADPYLRFWYRFVSPLIQGGVTSLLTPREVWDTRIAPRMSEHMGSVFEEIVRDFVASPEALPFRPERVGAWWDPASGDEVDVVAVSSAGDLLVGECKWGEATATHVEVLRRRAERIRAALGSRRPAQLALFTGAEPADPRVQRFIEDGELLHFTPHDLFGVGTPAGG